MWDATSPLVVVLRNNILTMGVARYFGLASVSLSHFAFKENPLNV